MIRMALLVLILSGCATQNSRIIDGEPVATPTGAVELCYREPDKCKNQ